MAKINRTRKSQAHPFTGGVPKKQTLKHRPAIWENMLGTVYARSPRGEIKYFDYNWDDARAFAGIDLTRTDQDLRIAKYQRRYQWTGSPETQPRNGQKVLWIKD
ncbi:MAG: hypothetical protein ACWGQW_00645 [bacterium]